MNDRHSLKRENRMAPEEICDILQKQFGDAVTDAVMSANRPYVVIEATRW